MIYYSTYAYLFVFSAINLIRTYFIKWLRNFLDPNFLTLFIRVILFLFSLFLFFQNNSRLNFSKILKNIYIISLISFLDILKMIVINHIMFNTKIFLHAFYIISAIENTLMILIGRNKNKFLLRNIYFNFCFGILGISLISINSISSLGKLFPLILIITLKIILIFNLKGKVKQCEQDICINLFSIFALSFFWILIRDLSKIPYLNNYLQNFFVDYFIFKLNIFSFFLYGIILIVAQAFTNYVTKSILIEKNNFFTLKYLQIILCNFISIIFIIIFDGSIYTSKYLYNIDVALFLVLLGLYGLYNTRIRLD